MTRSLGLAVMAVVFVSPLMAQPSGLDADSEKSPRESKKEKSRPPRIPDGPFVPKRGMIQRAKGQFWAGPPEEGRFTQIVTLTLVPREQLQKRLEEWPGYQELSGEQRARLVERIEQVREANRKHALEVAREFQLQVPPGEEEEFVRMYWRERVAIDQGLREEMSSKRKKLEKESEERLLRKFPRSGGKP